MRLDLLLHARRAVVGDETSERSCTVGVLDGQVVLIGAYDESLAHESAEVVELGEDVVLIPGLVDAHVHVNEPGRTSWEGFSTATRAAAAGGVTTILDMPLNSIPATTDPVAMEAKRAAAQGKCWVDVGFWGGAVPSNRTMLRQLHEAGAFGMKCFMLDSGVPEFPPLAADDLDDVLQEIASFDGLLLVHAEDAGVIDESANAGGASYDRFLASRPPEAETRAIDRVIAAARRTGARVHIVHLSSGDALPSIAAAKADGVRVTVETCPHYLSLVAEEVPVGATEFKCCPPIRVAANQDLLWAGLADGSIDMVVSDHSPSPPELKRRDEGDFQAAWGGIASLQLGLPVVWTEARRRGVTVAEVVGWMARRPADIAAVAGKGRIAIGCSADLVAFASEEEFVVDPSRLYHRHPITPYAGRKLRGVVRETWLRGVRVGDCPQGRLLIRGES